MSARRKQEAQTAGTVVLMLGLYLIILAFFILLNAISKVSQENFEKASESIMSGFGFRSVDQMQKQVDEEVSINRVYEQVASEIRGTLESYLALQDYTLTADREHMIVRMKPEVFFDDGSAKINPVQVEFFQDFARVLAKSRPGVRIRTDVSVHAVANKKLPQGISDIELAGMRAAIFLRALIERGLPSSLASANADEDQKPEIIVQMSVDVLDRDEALNAVRRAAIAPAQKEPAHE